MHVFRVLISSEYIENKMFISSLTVINQWTSMIYEARGTRQKKVKCPFSMENLRVNELSSNWCVN